MKELIKKIVKINLEEEQISLDWKDKIKTYFLLFMFCCLIGWIYEEIFYYVTEDWIGNRGFLYGPYLPVYGVGSLLMVFSLKKLKHHPIILFLLAAVITGVLEYITGEAMLFIWHKQWWDYTGLFLNYKGLVCFRSVLTFAVGGIGLIYAIEPIFNRVLHNLKEKTFNIIFYLLLITFIIDFIITITFRHPIF